MNNHYATQKNSNYVIIDGCVLDLSALKQEDKKTLSDLLNPYGPLYQPSLLEELIEQVSSELEQKIIPLYGGSSYRYKPRFETKKDLETFLRRTERVIEVDYLYEGHNGRVLGMYDGATDTIFILKNLNPEVKKFVKAHERAHRRRRFTGDPQDEYLVDLEARAEVGFDPLQRFSGYGMRRAA